MRGDDLHRQLIAELSAAGCFRPATLGCALYCAFILSCYGAAYAVLLSMPDAWLRAIAIVALAFISVHAAFVAHEAGHGAITRNRRVAGMVGQVFHTLLTGLSSTYFQHIHRVHHPHCNERARDPDMQSEFIAMYRESALRKTGLGRLISRHQAVLIWLLIGLQGFTLKFDGLQFVARNRSATRLDQVFLLLHVVLWFVPPVLALGASDALLNYSLMTVLIGFYVGSIFVVNHIGTRVIEPDERVPFFLQEVSVTRNLGSSRLADFVCGGLKSIYDLLLWRSFRKTKPPEER